MTLNVIAGNISGGGSAAVGAAVSVPVVTKETHAWIGNFAQVGAAGNTAITVPTGTYAVTSEDTRFDPQHAITGGNTINIGYTGQPERTATRCGTTTAAAPRSPASPTARSTT